MGAVDSTALSRDVVGFGDVMKALDERTLRILERRQNTVVVKRRGWLVRRALLAADAIGLMCAFMLSTLPFSQGSGDRFDPVTEFVLFLLTMPAWIVVAKLYRLYDKDEERADHSTADDLTGVFHMVTVGAWIVYAGTIVTGIPAPNLSKAALFWILAISLVTAARAGARAYCRRQIHYLQNTVIVGAGDVGQLIARKFIRHPEYGINLVGFLDDEPKGRTPELEHVALLGKPSRLPEIIRLLDVERVIIAFSNDSHEASLQLIRDLESHDVQIDIVPRLFEIFGPACGIHTVEGLPLVGLAPFRLTRSSRFLKRALDLTLGTVMLLLLAPMLVAIALLIKLDSPGVVFFRQVRIGSNSRPFRIFKFRTMVADAEERKGELEHLNKHARTGGDARMFKIPDDPRVTRVGGVLRRFSLDELPQVLNVLRGEMSFVGPRPLIATEDSHVVEEWARRRLDLKPGITGPWQVLGRTEIPFAEMVRLDYLYVTRWSLFSDLKLMLRTVPVLFRHSDST